MDDTDRRDVGQVEPFGDHLRADDDVDLATLDPAQHGRVAAVAANRVLVPAQYGGSRKELLDLVFDPLGTRPEVIQPAAARGAVLRGVFAVIAAVTDQA